MIWAELEAQNVATRVKDVFSNKVLNGEVITGKTPLGYKIKNKHLVPDEQAPAAQAAFSHYLKYNSLRRTLRMLNDDFGIVMTIQNLRKSVLENTKYIGLYRENPNFCPRLVDDETFYQVQDLLAKNIRSSQKYTFLFSGLLVCNSCGRKMVSCHINVKSVRKDVVRRYRYPAYHCQTYSRSHTCDNGGEIREVRIEEYLLANLQNEIRAYIAEYQTIRARQVDYRFKRRSLQTKIDRLKDLYLAEALTLEEFKRYRAEYLEQLAAIPSGIEPAKDFSHLEQVLNMDFENIYNTFNNEERRRFWRSIIREIRVSKSRNRSREYQILFL